MTSRIDKPIFRRVEKNFGEMLPYGSGTSKSAEQMRAALNKYMYYIPIELGNTAFGAPGKIEMKNQSGSGGIIGATMMKATMVKDFLIRKKSDSTPRRKGILVLEVKKIPKPAKKKVSSGGKRIHLTTRYIESERVIPNLKPILTDSEFQLDFRALNQMKGVYLVSAPSLLLNSGERGVIQVARKISFCSEYIAPGIKNAIKFKKHLPVVAAAPANQVHADVGLSMGVTATLAPGNMIRLDLNSELREFEGSLNYSNPIMAMKSRVIKGVKPVVADENIVEMPVFPLRRTELNCWFPTAPQC